MSRAAVVERSSAIRRSPRVLQLEGQFDIEAADKTSRSWSVELPLDDREWNIGAFIGPSGSGKTTLMCELFGTPTHLDWQPEAAIVDEFPPEMGIMDITGVLSSVGFSSPPAWLRPFDTLSNGEKFRAEIARTLVETAADEIAVVDEFTSVVDRTVAQIGSHAVAKFVRQRGAQLVIASCHYDIVDWLQPDWIYDTGAGEFIWRSLQRRPVVPLEIYRTTTEAWRWFSHHHYLSAKLSPAAVCYAATVDGQVAGFVGVLPLAGHPGRRRISRVVVLPDFQGVGVCSRLCALVGALWRAQGHRLSITTSHPAVVHSMARSAEWHMMRAPSRAGRIGRNSTMPTYQTSMKRYTASFEYVGPPGPIEQAEQLGIPSRSSVMARNAGKRTARKG